MSTLAEMMGYHPSPPDAGHSGPKMGSIFGISPPVTQGVRQVAEALMARQVALRRKRGRPRKGPQTSYDVMRAMVILHLIRDEQYRGSTIREMILDITAGAQKRGGAAALLFPRHRSIGQIEQSISKGRRKLGISPGWHRELAKKSD